MLGVIVEAALENEERLGARELLRR